MLKNPEDRRARRSRKLLKESLLALMKEKRLLFQTMGTVLLPLHMER